MVSCWHVRKAARQNRSASAFSNSRTIPTSAIWATGAPPSRPMYRLAALRADGRSSKAVPVLHLAHHVMVPPLAGRSPSYIVRQLYDIQYGFRRGPAVVVMLPEVAHLNAKDRIAIA